MYGDFGIESPSAPVTVTTNPNIPPGDFSLLAPENGSMVTDLTPTMMWENHGS